MEPAAMPAPSPQSTPPPVVLCNDCLGVVPQSDAPPCPVCAQPVGPACDPEHNHDRPAVGVMGLNR